MNSWYQIKIQYDKTQENGQVKKAKEIYLVDAATFADAEARAVEEFKPFISGDFEVSDIKKVKFSELLESAASDADKWYEGTLEIITLDEKTGKEKKGKTKMLIQASCLRDAMKNLEAAMKGSMSDFNAVLLKETPIQGILKYTE